MKRTLLLISLIACSLIFSSGIFAKGTEESLDQIVAVVNDDVVTKSELNRALELARIQIEQQRMTMPPAEALHKQVLDQLINKKLQVQVAKATGVVVSDAELNGALGRIASQNNMDVSTLLQRISQDGINPDDYKNEMHDQLLMQKLQQQQVVSRINITPEEVTSFMNSKLWQTNNNKEYHLQDILIPVSDTPSSEEIAKARTHAQEVVAKLNHGQDFNAVAAAESGNAQALKGGDLGWRKIPEIPSAFAEAVVHLQAKEIAGPIQTANGFHIIRVAAVRASGEKVATPDRKEIQNLLLQRKFEEAVQNWISRLRSQAFINTNPETA